MSNRLEALLKSNKINISVGLDEEKSLSNIRQGLKTLRTKLDGLDIELGVKFNPNVKELNGEIRALQNKINETATVKNAIKLDVEINSSIKALNSQILQLQDKIQNSKTIKPIKIGVEVDVAGSAKKMTDELTHIKNVLDKFENDYDSALKNVEKMGSANIGNIVSDETTNKLQRNLDTIKQSMNETFGDGLVSTKTIRDSENNITAFSSTVKRETGEMITAYHKLNEEGNLELFSTTQVNKMEEQTAKAKRSINSLSDEIKKVKSILGESQSFDLFEKLGKQEFVSEGEVQKLRELVKVEKDLINTNQKRKEFQDALTQSMKRMSPEVSNVANEVKKLDVSLDKLDSNELDKMSNKLKELNTQYRQDEQVFNKRNANLKEQQILYDRLTIAYDKMSKANASNRQANENAVDLLHEAKALNTVEASMKDLDKATRLYAQSRQEISKIEMNTKLESTTKAMEKQAEAIKKTIQDLKNIGKLDDDGVADAMLRLQETMATSERSVKDYGQTLKKELAEAKQEQKDLIKNFVLIEQKTDDLSKKKIQNGIFQSISNKDTNALKAYISELKGAEVNTISIREKTNQFGQAVDEIKVKMAGTGKTVEAYSFEVNKASKATDLMVKETGRAFVDNENKALGFFQQLDIAMKRIPAWIVSMQSFYAVVNGFKSVGREIMEINAQLIEIQRVASDGINVDSLFSSALAQSKELGANIHESLDSLGEFTRSYGEFAESQLLAVNKTAIMMSNVSDLTLSQSVENLIGTMNAFNISAEESIHIVDALNEVDNNYAVSTTQLANSLSKAGATATTFGVSMEELAGHTTAVGAVTMESGDIIGNSLKTIYSRITTMQPSIDILDSIGVSINKMGESGVEARSVGEILGDVASKWGTLTDSQRQNIGVTIAGRNQLSRFLALMNNWGMAQEATNSAINSTGSALKEQEIYLGSYEAKVNGIKTRFTELALGIGEAFLSDGMYLALDGIADLTEGLTNLIAKFGALPAMFGVLAGVGGKVTGLNKAVKDFVDSVGKGESVIGKFGKTLLSIKNIKIDDPIDAEGMTGKLQKAVQSAKQFGSTMADEFSKIKAGLTSTSSEMVTVRNGVNGITVAQGGLALATTGVKGAFLELGGAVKTFMFSAGGIMLAVTAIGAVVGKIIEKTIKAKKEAEELTKAYEENNKKSLEAFNKQGNNVDDLISNYERLHEAKIKAERSGKELDATSLQEYEKAVNDIAQAMPNAISYTDANGKAHLQSSKLIKKEAERLQELNKMQEASIKSEYQESLKKRSEDYKTLLKDFDKYSKKVESYEKAQEARKNQKTTMTSTGVNTQTDNMWTPMTTSTKEYEQAVIGAQRAQSNMSLALSESAVEIGENVRQTLTARGALGNMSDAGKGVIDSYAKMTQAGIENIKSLEDFEKAQNKLQENTEKFGESLAQAYTDITKGLGEGLGEKGKAMFDGILQGFDEKFFKGDIEDVQGKIKGLSSAVIDMSNNTNGFDINAFMQKLRDGGMSAEEAKKATMDLGVALENSAIKSMIASEEMSTYNDELLSMATATWEAIDAKKVMMGLDDGEAEDITSRLEYLKAMKEMNEETWLQNARVQEELDNLQSKTGISKQKIQENTLGIYEAYSTMTKLSAPELAKFTNMNRDQLREANKDMSEEGFALLQVLVENMKNGASSVSVALIQALSDGSKEIDGKTEELKKSFEELRKAPAGDTNAQSSVFNGIKDDLEALQGQITLVKNDAGELQLAMLNGERSTYLDELNKQLEDMGIKLEVVKGVDGENVIHFAGADGELHKLASLNTELDIMGISTALLSDNFVKFKNDMNEATESQWLNGIKTQFETLKDEVELVDKGTENAKLQLNGGGTSPWLDELNRQVKSLNGEIIETKTKTGELEYVLKVGDKEYPLFSGMKQGAEQAKVETDKAKQSVAELKTKGEEGITVNMNPLAGGLTVSATEEQNKAQASLDLSGGLKTKVNVDDTDYKQKTEEINKTIAEPKPFNIEMKVIEQSDGTLETTQRRIQTLVENMTSLENGTQQVVSLIDNGILAKDPLVQSLASKLGELAEIATNAKKQIEELTNKIQTSDFTFKGKFELTGLDTAEKQINDLAKTLSGSSGGIKTAMTQLQNSMNGLKIGSIDTSELTRFKSTVIQTMNETTALLANYGSTVAQAIAQANASMVFNTTGLIVYRTVTVSTISSMIASWSGLQMTLPNIIVTMGRTMNQAYNQATNAMVQRTDWLRQQLSQKFASITSAVVSQMRTMTARMTATFRAGTSQLANIASDIPRQIGNGISRNMGSATSSLQSLADNMVSRFKEALGIHSPSRVFEELGGFVIQGLANGLTGGDLKSLGMNVFKDFGGGIFDSLDMIKAYVSGDFSAFIGEAGAGVQQWAGIATKALMMTGQYSPANLQALLYQMQTESGGNPRAINNWDINAINGTPSKGLMQVIDPTFRAYAMPGFNNIWSPLDNILASIRYAVSRYGSLQNAYRGVGYANGGFIDEPELAWHAEEGEEVIIPLIPKRRKRGLQLWLETAEKLGITNGLQMPFSHGSNYVSGGSVGGYGLSDGESTSSSGGGAEGMSGTVTPTMPTISMNAPDLSFKAIQPAFALSDEKSLEALYKRDVAGLEMDKTESFLTKANQKLKTLNEGTVEYRTQIRVIQKLNQQLLAQEKQQLANTQKRQKAIEKELKTLKNTGKHTEAQRKRYNELQQEYDNNTKQIWKLEESIDSLNTTIYDFNISNHIDYLNEISTKYDEVIAKFERANSKLNLEYEKMQIQDPTNVGGQLALRYDMLEEQFKIEDTKKNKVASLRKEYEHLIDIVGVNDKRTIEAKKMLEKAEDDYQKEVLETLKLEKAIKDEREKVAKDSISALKTYYKQMETLSKNALAKEKENLKKSHDEKIKYYDKEIAKINEVYDAKLKEREEEKSEKAYAEKMTEYNEERSELMKKISMASKDTSIEGKKKLNQLQKDLLELNKEIAKAQEERHDELWKKELEAQKQQQLDALNNQKEIENDAYENQLEEIENREKAIADYYKKMTSDEAMWKKATDAWNAGDTSILTDMMNDMREGMSAIMGGNGTGIMGAENLTAEDLKELLGDSMIDISNIWLEISDQLKELDSINNNLGDLNSKDQNGYQLGNLPFRDDANAKPPTTSQNNVQPDLSEPNKPKPKPNNNNGVKGYHTVVRGDTLWDLAKKYYGDYYKWTKIQKANGNIDPYRLPIGKKLMIPMRTGGYTGDWVGDDGRVALLHKKELVLNQQQTRDILDTVSILDKANSKFLNQADKLRVSQQQSVKNNITKFGDINLHFDGFKGTKQEANYVAEELLKSLGKKR